MIATQQKILAAFIVSTLVLAGWFLRYDIHVGQVGGEGNIAPVYMLNRWTGELYLITPNVVRQVKRVPPSQESK